MPNDIYQGWVVKEPDGTIRCHTIRYLRHLAILEYCRNPIQSEWNWRKRWRKLYQRGFRCVRLKIRELSIDEYRHEKSLDNLPF